MAVSIVGSVFVSRRSTDGEDVETFCAGGVHFSVYEVFPADEKWYLSREKPLCDKSCKPVGVEAVAAIFHKEMAEAARLPIEVQDGFETVLARPSLTARVFETWYAKRGGKGTAACLGDVHVESSWECDPGISCHYVGVEFTFKPCDGSCRPRCERVSLA